MNTRALCAVVISALVWAVAGSGGCSRCADDGVPEAKEVEGSSPLLWESVELGVDRQRFSSDLARLAGIPAEEAKARIGCRDQFTMDAIDPGERAITERSGRGHDLGNCTLQQAGADRSWSLISARGELLDGKLVRVTFAFGPDQHDRLAQDLTARFGPGKGLELEERSAVLLDGEVRRCTLWKRRGELIALVQGRREARLIRQSDGLAELLPPLPEAAERGEPVKLDDIGLGGGLDLDAPLPSVEGLVGGDR
jgi:hypothetical protein